MTKVTHFPSMSPIKVSRLTSLPFVSNKITSETMMSRAPQYRSTWARIGSLGFKITLFCKFWSVCNHVRFSNVCHILRFPQLCSHSWSYHQDKSTHEPPLNHSTFPTHQKFVKKAIPIHPFHKNGTMKNDNPLLDLPGSIFPVPDWNTAQNNLTMP